ncbi:hypothetical protein LTS17_009849 [Exophiala oligosperma]
MQDGRRGTKHQDTTNRSADRNKESNDLGTFFEIQYRGSDIRSYNDKFTTLALAVGDLVSEYAKMERYIQSMRPRNGGGRDSGGHLRAREASEGVLTQPSAIAIAGRQAGGEWQSMYDGGQAETKAVL